MAYIDNTSYDAAHVPNKALKAIFAEHDIPTDIRKAAYHRETVAFILSEYRPPQKAEASAGGGPRGYCDPLFGSMPVMQAMANAKMLSPEQVASLGSEQAMAEQRLQDIFGASLLKDLSAADKAIALMQMATVWRCAGQVANLRATRAVRLEENPHIVPDLPGDTYIQMCESFQLSHPQDYGLPQDTPHEKFCARLSRDVTVSGVVPAYELGWVRLKSETVTTKPGFGSTPDMLVQIQRDEQPAIVLGAEDTRNRIIAYYKAPLLRHSL